MSDAELKQKIKERLGSCIVETNFDENCHPERNTVQKSVGKVRDTYDLGDELLIVTTDRQSAFDRLLAAVPFKGEVLNRFSEFWFKHTKDIIPNSMIDCPKPNQMRMKKCDVFPVEFVVRAYMTGSTSTSLWTHYQNGAREYCGHHLPDGLKKNDKLEKPIVTPTTKSAEHDEIISGKKIVEQGLMSQDDWDYCEAKALEVFEYGSGLAKQRGWILVDTKFEMGKSKDGEILLIDEVLTPDSSRYWKADTLEHFDKEFLRLWFAGHCDPYNDKVLPKAPDEMIIELSYRYIRMFESISGLTF